MGSDAENGGSQVIKKTIFASLIVLSFLTSTVWAEERRVDYEGYTLWLDCEKRSAVRFEYTIGRDTGDEKRKYYKKYRFDSSLSDCQQSSTKSYWKESNQTYQRGHLVSFNHLVFSPESASDANQMANILPQHKTLNQGAWKVTEEITECFREFGTLLVVGGAIWDDETRMLEVHGVDIPDYFWKVIIRDDEAIAWIMPNDKTATAEALDTFLVGLKEVEKETGVTFDLGYDKDAKPERSWDVSICDQLGDWKR